MNHPPDPAYDLASLASLVKALARAQQRPAPAKGNALLTENEMPGSQVRVRLESLQAAWRISVIDQGPGITPLDRSRMFEVFTRRSARATAGERNTGLGLAITRSLVEAPGGQIDAECAPQGGAIFRFSLPQEPD